MRQGRTFGFDFVPVTLQLTASTLGFLPCRRPRSPGRRSPRSPSGGRRGDARRAAADPAAGGVRRARRARVVLRLLELTRQLVQRDPISQGWNLLVPALLVAGGVGVAGSLLLRTARRRGAVPVVGGLGDELSAIGFPSPWR
jgi:hypothetical protein